MFEKIATDTSGADTVAEDAPKTARPLLPLECKRCPLAGGKAMCTKVAERILATEIPDTTFERYGRRGPEVDAHLLVTSIQHAAHMRRIGVPACVELRNSQPNEVKPLDIAPVVTTAL